MMQKKKINQSYLEGERPLFQGKHLEIHDTIFAKGESPLKESQDISLYTTIFQWKYPLWYSRKIYAEDCILYRKPPAWHWRTLPYPLPAGAGKVSPARLPLSG